MSAGVTLSCDGRRSGQPCRGALHTPASQTDEARHRFGKPAGWRGRLALEANDPTRYRVIDTCPSPGHDEQLPAGPYTSTPATRTEVSPP